MERYFFFGILLSVFIFTFFIFRPFWIVLTLGISFSIVLYPIYTWFRSKINSWLSAFLTVLIFTVIICGPALLIGTMVFDQSREVYSSVVKNNNAGPFINSLDVSINKLLPRGITFNTKERATTFIASITNNIEAIFNATISTAFSFFLILLAIFYFLKDGESWKKALIIMSPLADADDEKIMKRFALAVNGVIKGSLLVALAQGILMGAGLALFGVPNPALWGIIAAICSLAPTIGTAFVSIPAILFLLIQGQTGAAIGFLIWALVAVGMIDNVLSPFIVGKKMNMPPIIILFSILGGIVLLGPVGILVGPLSVSLLYTLLSIYRHDLKPENLI